MVRVTVLSCTHLQGTGKKYILGHSIAECSSGLHAVAPCGFDKSKNKENNYNNEYGKEKYKFSILKKEKKSSTKVCIVAYLNRGSIARIYTHDCIRFIGVKDVLGLLIIKIIAEWCKDSKKNDLERVMFV